jgi:PKHD-type hydroxylase
MEYMLTPYSDKIESFVYWENAFNKEELNYLQNIAVKSQQNSYVSGGENGIINEDIRRSKVTWLHNNKDSEWLYQRIANIVSELNSRFFRFNLTGFGEPFQLTNYDSSYQGTYNWHQDFGSKISRKLSCVMQLTDPSEYEGGNLEIMTSSTSTKINKCRGLITIFPSWTLHRVSPVTQGSRQSLVSWISGPEFK